jgi:hypothetical protein
MVYVFILKFNLLKPKLRFINCHFTYEHFFVKLKAKTINKDL